MTCHPWSRCRPRRKTGDGAHRLLSVRSSATHRAQRHRSSASSQRASNDRRHCAQTAAGRRTLREPCAPPRSAERREDCRCVQSDPQRPQVLPRDRSEHALLAGSLRARSRLLCSAPRIVSRNWTGHTVRSTATAHELTALESDCCTLIWSNLMIVGQEIRCGNHLESGFLKLSQSRLVSCI